MSKLLASHSPGMLLEAYAHQVEDTVVFLIPSSSFSILSDDRFKASSKTISPHSAIQRFLYQVNNFNQNIIAYFMNRSIRLNLSWYAYHEEWNIKVRFLSVRATSSYEISELYRAWSWCKRSTKLQLPCHRKDTITPTHSSHSVLSVEITTVYS
jgi:hypothetical protein